MLRKDSRSNWCLRVTSVFLLVIGCGGDSGQPDDSIGDLEGDSSVSTIPVDIQT